MEVCAHLVADPQAFELVQPGKCALHDPTGLSALIAGVLIDMASTVFTAVPIAVQLEGSRPAPPVHPKRGEDNGARSPLAQRGRARDSGAVV